MKITQIRIKKTSTHNILTAECGGFDLWYKFPSRFELSLSADPFICASLFPAMVLGSNIELDNDANYSKILRDNLEKLQTIFCFWSEYFRHPLNKIEIIGGNAIDDTSSCNKIASFFSGGIDGSYTFKKHQDDIDLLLFVKGIDMQLTSDQLYEEAFARNQDYLASRNKELISCESNVRFLGVKHGLSWTRCLGGGLSSIALALGVKKCFIASSLTYENVVPEGSNYVTDHLWSNGCTEIIHDGAESRRIDKLKLIAQDEGLLRILRVCWQDTTYNCGKCEKCLRTMATIRALNLHVPTFPPLTDELIINTLRRQKLHSEHDVQFYEENIKQALKVNDKILSSCLSRILKDFKKRRMLRMIDNTLFSGKISKLRKSI